MKTIRVNQLGFSAFGKRFAEAVRDQSDMTVSGIVESDPVAGEVARRLGFPVTVTIPAQARELADVWVDCRGTQCTAASEPITQEERSGLGVPLFGAPAAEDSPKLRLPGLDVVALLRLLTGLSTFGPWVRIFATAVCPPLSPSLELDTLRLVTDRTGDDADLQEAFVGTLPEVEVRRVSAPCTQSRLYLLRLDSQHSLDAAKVLQALALAPRILVGRSGDGFPHTAAVREYFRNLGWRRGEYPGLWVWKESVSVREHTLFLTANLAVHAGPIPEWIDAVRCLGTPAVGLEEARCITDHNLGLKVVPGLEEVAT